MVITISAFALVLLFQSAPQDAGGPSSVSQQIACAPMSLPAPPVPTMRVVGGVHGRMMFGPGDPVVINAGTAKGLQAGQQYFVRRYIQDRFTPPSDGFIPNSIHTAGWITIVDAKDTMAIATVTHACDGVLEGDYLEPFVVPAIPPPPLAAAPDFEHPGRIVMADERRQEGYPGLVMLINRGTDHGVRAGHALTIYRPSRGGEGPSVTVGTATVLSAGPMLSVVRIDTSRDAIHIGDYAAVHRITQ